MVRVGAGLKTFTVTAEGMGKIKTVKIQASSPQMALRKFKQYYPEWSSEYKISEDHKVTE